MKKEEEHLPEHIKERRAIKEELARRCDYDIGKFAEMIKKTEKEYLREHPRKKVYSNA